MAEATTPDIEIRVGEIVAFFPGGIDASYLTVNAARAWAHALLSAADAADLLAKYSTDSG